MKISLEDLNRAGVPHTALRTEFIDGVRYISIRNDIYCQRVWVWLWYHRYLPLYRNQSIVDYIETINLSSAILINGDTNELLTQSNTAKNVEYFGATDFNLPPPFSFNVSGGFSVSLFVVLVGFIGIICIVLALITKNDAILKII